MRNWDLREFHVWVNLLCPIQQVQVLIRQVIIPIRGHPHPIKRVVLLISQVRSYPPYCSHLYPLSLSFSSTTLPSLQEHKVKSFLCISPCHHHELTPSAPDAEYNIHLKFSVVPYFSQFHKTFKGEVSSSHFHGFEFTNRWIESQHLACLPSTASRSTTSKYSSTLPRS